MIPPLKLRFFYPVFSLVAVVLIILPSGFACGATDSELEAEIEHYVKELRCRGVIRGDERTAWLVYDLASEKELVSINEDAQLQAASMIKPYLALAFFHQVEAGKLSCGTQGRRHLELMIQKSNNTSTNWVMKQTGGPVATQALLKRHYPLLCRQLHLVEYIPQGGRTYLSMKNRYSL